MKANDSLVKEVEALKASENFFVTQENRETLYELIAQKTLEVIKVKSKSDAKRLNL